MDVVRHWFALILMKSLNHITLLTVFFLASCIDSRTDELNEISKSCLCSVNYEMTTSDETTEKPFHKFIYKGSPVFNYGVSRRAFANSEVIKICDSWGLDLSSSIQINIVKDTIDNTVNFTTIDYKASQMTDFISDYRSIKNLLNHFISNIYDDNFISCHELTSKQIGIDEFSDILKNAKQSFFGDYGSTIIVGYDIEDNNGKVYTISGGVMSKSNDIYLFSARIRKHEEKFIISEISFT
ncbi:hypothetical protein [Fulvivirga ligni]|uniref:hypothetical protein n=1 Tax=Fulvivirga ligni TaxID=2904246 RepID=UPI001F1F85B9|nr:hypothetical protein [Fulvivirga ligni]UII20257.1 hypothetical protein LVD16_20650 [Fulvivirga ligni]